MSPLTNSDNCDRSVVIITAGAVVCVNVDFVCCDTGVTILSKNEKSAFEQRKVRF